MSRTTKLLLGFLLLFIVLGALFWYFSTQKTTPNQPNDTTRVDALPQDSSAENPQLFSNIQTADTITICSFNIQFLGNSKKRDNAALADVVKDFEIVVVQELVAPPANGVYPDGTAYVADDEAVSFINAMAQHGFRWVYSEEDTGTGDKIHVASSSTEWWIVFYKPAAVLPDTSIPHGFLADDRSNHPDYERVPYSFGFETTHTGADFSLISVHLQPGEKASETARRKHELTSISNWIAANSSTEKDIIILGDMNIYSQEELIAATPIGYKSLNDKCVRTNTLINADKDGGARPYDHVMFSTTFTQQEIDTIYGFKVLNLIDLMRSYWKSAEPYPGDPYNHNAFRSYYSDHHPVAFQLIFTEDDD